MIASATTDAEVQDIKKNRLIGVEQQATMYALAASNMILRGDGKANLYQGSCFDPGITKAVTAHHPTIGMINPPYAKSKADLHELRFVEHMLDGLEKEGLASPSSRSLAPLIFPCTRKTSWGNTRLKPLCPCLQSSSTRLAP